MMQVLPLFRSAVITLELYYLTLVIFLDVCNIFVKNVIIARVVQNFFEEYIMNSLSP